jgi:hypothetical protein
MRLLQKKTKKKYKKKKKKKKKKDPWEPVSLKTKTKKKWD